MLKDFFELSENYKDVKIKSNYHTHNFLCGHAGGDVSDYVEQAVKNGLEIIGISDHCVPPVHVGDPYVLPDEMETRYLPQFEAACAKYGDRIKILTAVEIEYFEGHDEYYKKLLEKLNYLVMGQHIYLYHGMPRNSFVDGRDDGNIAAYCKCVEAGCRSGLFSILAHPDLIFYCRPKLTCKAEQAFSDMIKTAVDCGVAVELNANGIRYHRFNYPTDLLIGLCKKYGAKTVVSADAHSPDCLCDEYTRRLYAYALAQGLNVVDKISTDKFIKR